MWICAGNRWMMRQALPCSLSLPFVLLFPVAFTDLLLFSPKATFSVIMVELCYTATPTALINEPSFKNTNPPPRFPIISENLFSQGLSGEYRCEIVRVKALECWS